MRVLVRVAFPSISIRVHASAMTRNVTGHSDDWLANPTWGRPRIQAELAKIGVRVSDSTVRKYKPKRRGPPSQEWRTFLENHLDCTVGMDFFVVVTATFRILYVLVIVSHERRRVVYFNVTASPSAQWTAQQVVQAFPFDTAPRFLMRDRRAARRPWEVPGEGYPKGCCRPSPSVVIPRGRGVGLGARCFG
jgi:hypothetical protein